ncbi:MAG TPA: hypothetical protein VEJ37_02445 [Xanthobacteraceae bacterium]|nr:hypothetical protein [Xanthobacteraceae bacterium]
MIDEWNRKLPRDQAGFERGANENANRRRGQAERRQKILDDELDRELEDTFPGSDPVAVTQPPHGALDKRKPKTADHNDNVIPLIQCDIWELGSERGVTRGRKIIEYILRQISPGTR